jgi:hypothetical protein
MSEDSSIHGLGIDGQDFLSCFSGIITLHWECVLCWPTAFIWEWPPKKTLVFPVRSSKDLPGIGGFLLEQGQSHEMVDTFCRIFLLVISGGGASLSPKVLNVHKSRCLQLQRKGSKTKIGYKIFNPFEEDYTSHPSISSRHKRWQIYYT